VKRPYEKKLRDGEERDTKKLEVERKKERKEKADGGREENV
jgi:hypothetical protein